MKLPYNFLPRDYQLPLLDALDGGVKRAFCLWHRKCGKDKVLWNYIIKKAFEEAGNYYYFFPTYSLAKKVIWNGIDNDGFKFIDHVPKDLIIGRPNSQDLSINMRTNDGKTSIIQLIGTDDVNSTRGPNPKFCVFSEYAFQNPMVWETIRPILAMNDGGAVFNTTPNGDNHAKDLFEMATNNQEKWFTQILTVEDTKILSKETLEQERLEMTREMFEQEYYCNFNVGMIGGVYAEQMEVLQDEGRITELPFYKDIEIDITFDIGISKGNETAIWFTQKVGEFIHFVNYVEGSGKTFEYFSSLIGGYLQEKNAKLGTINIPHDAKKRDWITGNTAQKAFRDRFGIHKVRTLSAGSPNDTGDFQIVRKLFPRFKFDRDRCNQGIRAINNYKYEYDRVKKIFKKTPLHDWSSNGADALRYRAVAEREGKPFVYKPYKKGHLEKLEESFNKFR